MRFLRAPNPSRATGETSRGEAAPCPYLLVAYPHAIEVLGLSRFLEDGNVLNQAIGEVVEWAASGAFKDDDAGRMTGADRPKL